MSTPITAEVVPLPHPPRPDLWGYGWLDSDGQWRFVGSSFEWNCDCTDDRWSLEQAKDRPRGFVFRIPGEPLVASDPAASVEKAEGAKP